VDEVLAIGIQVASAVETAHRAGIAHRDIKPANILVTDYNRPALADFGISGTVEGSGDADLGMSIPWSPPESFRGGPVDGVALDVWALGATLYTLLAGRSPFVVPGADNSQRALVQRIHSSPVPAIGRADVPESFELVLATAMSKAPESRYSSAHTLALALQRIQSELSLSVTPFEVLEDATEADDPDTSYEETRVRGIIAIRPQGPPSGSSPATPGRTTPSLAAGAARTAGTGTTTGRRDDTVARGRTDAQIPGTQIPVTHIPGTQVPGTQAEPDGEPTVFRGAGRAAGPEGGTGLHGDTGFHGGADTVLRGQRGAHRTDLENGSEPQAAGEGHAEGARRRRAFWAAGAAAAVLLAAVGAGVALAPGLASRPTPNQATPSAPPVDAVDSGAVPNVTGLKGTAGAAGVTFTWTNPQPRPGDAYMVTVLRLTGQEPPATVTGTSATVPAEASGQTCVRVVVRRSDGAAGAMDESAPSACVTTK
jgi:hypothetical protein